MTILNAIFNNKFPDFDKLLPFGFILSGDKYVYSRNIVQDQFVLRVEILDDGTTKTQLIDPYTSEEYVLHLVQSAEGRFVGQVRREYEQVLQEIVDHCFYSKVFKSPLADQIMEYVKQTYHDTFEFLWNKFPDNAIVRRQDNKKWYAAILTTGRNKIGLDGDEKIEIIDLRVKTEDLEKLVDGKKYFPGYHMNKKHWITLCLDGRIPLDEILQRIDESYLLAKK